MNKEQLYIRIQQFTHFRTLQGVREDFEGGFITDEEAKTFQDLLGRWLQRAQTHFAGSEI